jgi:hypothetical protein
MSVYFIQAGEGGPVKIGTAISARVRMDSLQVGHYEELFLLRTLDGGRPLEQWLHGKFIERRIRGEWFHFCPTMLTIDAPLYLLDRKIALDRAPDVNHIIEMLGGQSNVAAICGAKKDAVIHWYKHGFPLRYWLVIMRYAYDNNIPGITRNTLMAIRHPCQIAPS